MGSVNSINLFFLHKSIRATYSKWLWVRGNVQSNLFEIEGSWQGMTGSVSTLLSCSSRACCDTATGSSPMQSTLISFFTHCFPDTFCPKVFLLVFSSPPSQCLHISQSTMKACTTSSIKPFLITSAHIRFLFFLVWNYGIDYPYRINKHWRGPVSGEPTFKSVRIVRIPTSVTFAFELL